MWLPELSGDLTLGRATVDYPAMGFNKRKMEDARGAAITAGYWFGARCPACRTTCDVDLRTLDWHRGAAVTAPFPALSCRSCRPNAPFAE
jgi:hypothetical protein